MQGIDRRHREVTALDPRTMTEVAAFVSPFRVPAGFGRVDLVEATADVRAPADIVENKEFVFRPEIGGVGNPGGLQIGFGTTGDRTRIALIALHGVRLDHVTGQIQRRLFKKRIDAGGFRVRHQNHVRFLNALPAGDGRAVEHLAVLEDIFADLADGDGNVLFLATGVGEPVVHKLDALFFHQLHHISSFHWSKFLGVMSGVNSGETKYPAFLARSMP